MFIDPAKIKDVAAKLTFQGFTLHPYDALPEKLSGLKTAQLYYNPENTNVLLSEAIPPNIKTAKKAGDDIIVAMKCVKSDAEVANIKNAFIKEGVVMVKAIKWLEDSIGKVPLECDVVDILKTFRGEQEHYLCDSFSTISAYGANAAQAHYRPEDGGAEIKPDTFYLLDTGGQYLDGTTDTTRTLCLCEPTAEMKRDYTLVLKGNIALSRAIFPDKTLGMALDVLARQAIWEDGQNFGHGTGHGLGYCLSVHEGPQGISPRINKTGLVAGMLLSNEPALYKEGCYGIRTENILLVVENKKTSAGTFLAFETLTHCPIDTKAIDTTMLTDTECKWLNAYHSRTYDTLSPHLNEDERAWLKAKTEPISYTVVF